MKEFKQNLSRFLFSLIIMPMIILLAGCNTAVQSKTIRVGVRDSVPGFGYKNPRSGTYSGMEVELAKMLAQALGYDHVEFIGVTADTREQVLREGKADFIVATFTITEEREQEFEFSAPYYSTYLRVMVQNSALFQDLRDLHGKRIGVSSGSTSALYLAEEMAREGAISGFDKESFDPSTFHAGITFKSLDTYPELDAALEKGEIDAICTDSSILMGYLNEERNLLPEEFARQDLGVCTPKGSPLSEKINTQISQWRDDGQLDSLIAKWDLDR